MRRLSLVFVVTALTAGCRMCGFWELEKNRTAPLLRLTTSSVIEVASTFQQQDGGTLLQFDRIDVRDGSALRATRDLHDFVDAGPQERVFDPIGFVPSTGDILVEDAPFDSPSNEQRVLVFDSPTAWPSDGGAPVLEGRIAFAESGPVEHFWARSEVSHASAPLVATLSYGQCNRITCTRLSAVRLLGGQTTTSRIPLETWPFEDARGALHFTAVSDDGAGGIWVGSVAGTEPTRLVHVGADGALLSSTRWGTEQKAPSIQVCGSDIVVAAVDGDSHQVVVDLLSAKDLSRSDRWSVGEDWVSYFTVACQQDVIGLATAEREHLRVWELPRGAPPQRRSSIALSAYGDPTIVVSADGTIVAGALDVTDPDSTLLVSWSDRRAHKHFRIARTVVGVPGE